MANLHSQSINRLIKYVMNVLCEVFFPSHLTYACHLFVGAKKCLKKIKSHCQHANMNLSLFHVISIYIILSGRTLVNFLFYYF